MKTQRVIYGVILLAFVGVLIPVSLLLIVGVVVGVILLLDGVGFFDKSERLVSSAPTNTTLSFLDRTVLEMFSQNKTVDEIAKSTGVSAPVVNEKAALLTSTGYLSNNMLTEKGFEAVRGSGARTL